MSTAPADAEVRSRLVTELDITFFVEAGAGTGKTRELVARIVALVAAGQLRMEELAAITFTDAAAAELRDRVRQALDLAAVDSTRARDERERCQQAAGEIDHAAIQTIHAFAGALLRAHPLEAGLPPSFETWDEIQRDLAFAERFRTWLYEEVPAGEGSGPRSALRRVLALGMSPDDLRELAARLQEHEDLLQPETTWARELPPDALAAAHELGAALLDLEALLPLARNPGDELAREVGRVRFPARGLAAAGFPEEALAALQGLVTCWPRRVGRQSDWDADGGEHPVKRIKRTFKDCLEEAQEVLAAHRAAALAGLLDHLRDFTLACAAERRQQGVATFQDLLVGARDLLRDHPEVRRAAHARYRRIFVDEFQDTDPLQAEIVWLLAADPGQAHERDWRRLQPLPGHLFLVGDPKQSIYRFRRADIRVYEEVGRGLEDPRGWVSLVQNFRSAAPVLAWVNYHLSREMQGQPGVQAAFAALSARPPRLPPEIEEGRCGVYAFGDQIMGRAAERWWLEAWAVAETARWMVDERWPVSSPDSAEGARPARYADICVLIPSRTNLRGLERAFEDWGVPYRMESGSLVLHTQEVRDLLSCLRAIDDPADQVALVATLRSAAFACSDADLLAWVEAGGRLDYEQPGEDSPGRVQEALACLRTFHAERLGRSTAATLEAFIHQRLLAVGAFGQARPREVWRRLRYVVERARTFAASGQPSPRAFLDWMETLQQRASHDNESVIPEGDEDAVRIMTVHGAKGLEFPIVILTGLGSAPSRHRGGVVVVPDHERRTVEVRRGDFQTSAFDQEREQSLNEAEKVRLLYVAATRARDYLVLSLYRGKDGCPASRIAAGLVDAPEGLVRPLILGGTPPPGLPRAVSEGDDIEPAAHAQAEGTWLDARAALVARLAEKPVVAPSQLARADRGSSAASGFEDGDLETEAEELVPGASVDDAEPVVTSRREEAAAIGLAVHGVLEAIDLATLEGLEALAGRLAAENGVAHRVDEVYAFARAAAGSPVVQGVLSSGRYWREVPVGVERQGVLVQGRIDLLHENPDGSLEIVDYKTDRVDRATTAARAATHRLQAGAYALAVQAATGRAVTSVAFVFAAADGAAVAYTGAEVQALVGEAERALLETGARA